MIQLSIRIEKRVVSVETEAGVAVLDGTNAEELIEQFNEAKAALIRITKEKEAAEKALRDLMGDATIATIDGIDRLKLIPGSRETVSAKMLKAEFPEMHAELTRKGVITTSTYTVLKSV